MSRGMLKQCPACKGADTDLRPCTTCKGVRMVPDSPAGAPDDVPVSDGGVLYIASTALKEAATNYAATLLMSRATSDHVNRAFESLQQAAADFTHIKDLQEKKK